MRKLTTKYSRKRNVAKKKTMKGLVAVYREPHEESETFRKYGDINYKKIIKG